MIAWLKYSEYAFFKNNQIIGFNIKAQEKTHLKN